MLRITVEIENPMSRQRRLLASGSIGNQGGGELSDYLVMLNEVVGSETDVYSGQVNQYPRWAASVWDLVARGILASLYGTENPPERPISVSARVPIQQTADGFKYVRLIDLPYPAGHALEHNLNTRSSSRPVVEGEEFRIAYLHDFIDFLAGAR